MAKLEEKFDNLDKKVDNLDIKLDTLLEKLESKFVSIERFTPVEKVVYGLVSFTLLAVLGSIIALVIK